MICSLVIALLVQLTHTASGDFTKITRTKDGEEVVSGRFYWMFPGRKLFWVQNPVNQIMTSNRDTLILYYPDDLKAFKIVTKGAARGWWEWGLDIRSVLCRDRRAFLKKSSGDTLYSYWAREGKGKTPCLILGEVEDRVVSIQAKDKDHRLLAKTLFLEWTDCDTIRIPTKIQSLRVLGADTIEETITYRDISFRAEIPDSILDFRIPEGTEVKEVE